MPALRYVWHGKQVKRALNISCSFPRATWGSVAVRNVALLGCYFTRDDFVTFATYSTRGSILLIPDSASLGQSATGKSPGPHASLQH